VVNFIQTRAGVGRSIPKAEVPPCASCHEPDAKGADAFPPLEGELHDYMFRKLTNWDTERGQDKGKPDTSAIIGPIAHNLSEAQVKWRPALVGGAVCTENLTAGVVVVKSAQDGA
jgi:cytochrome c553